jgi:hypothetical protein
MSKYEQRIQRYLDSHPGATRSDARGHKNTPERPERADNNPNRYKDYTARRQALKTAVKEKVARLSNSSDKWRADRSARNIASYRGPMAEMQKFLDDKLGNIQWINQDTGEPDERYSYLWYH